MTEEMQIEFKSQKSKKKAYLGMCVCV